MSDRPTLKSLEIGLKTMQVEIHDRDAQLQMATEDQKSQLQFLDEPRFKALVAAFHNMLHHQAPIEGNCDMQKQFLLAIMTKLFCAGWFAGRQELMDEFISQTVKP